MIQKPKGTRDLLPKDSEKARRSEDLFVKIAKQYGFEEIRYPMFEKTELFERGIGETTDVVQKEMFRVISAANLIKYREGEHDLQKEGMTLRPEGTACVVRSFIENKLYAEALPAKYFYSGSHFRNERPQAGRYREFTQYGVEVFGSDDPFTDAEVIALAMDIIKAHGVPQAHLKINSVGCPHCRPRYHEKLKEFLADKKDDLCADCRDRFDKNPLRILDCKVPADQEAIQGHPTILEYLCDTCSSHFEGLKQQLRALGIEFEVDPGIVRGLDYYVRTAFEIMGGSFGTQNTLCGGGRYDGLIQLLDGPDIPGIGFGMGMDRLILAADEVAGEAAKPERRGILVVPLGDGAAVAATEILEKLRAAGHFVQREVQGRSLKAAFKYGDKKNYRYMMILGDQEIETKTVLLKDLEKGAQDQVPWELILKVLEES